MAVPAIPAIIACATNPVCATGAAVIAFGGAMMTAQNAQKPQGMFARKDGDFAPPLGTTGTMKQYEGLLKGGSSSPPNGPQDECDTLHDHIQGKLLDYAKAPGGEGELDIEGALEKYTAQCKDVDPNFQVKHDFLKAKHNVMNFYDDLKANYFPARR